MTTITTDTIKVKVQGISNEIEAKIDTGAEQSSLHGENITIKDDHVIFQLNDRIYKAPLEKQQDVSSADGGTQTRPVIKTVIEIEGQSIETLLNVNDRGEMPQQLLIGQDVIKAANLTLKFSSEPTSTGAEEEEVNGQQDTQSQESGPNAPPVVNPAVPDNVELKAQALALTQEIVEMYKHLSSLEATLDQVRKQAFGLLKAAGVVTQPTVPETQQAAQPAASEIPTVFTPYEPK